MQQVTIEAREIRPDDYLAGGVGAGPRPERRVRRVWTAFGREDLDPAQGPEWSAEPGYIVAAIAGHNGVGARQLLRITQPVVVWR